MVINMKAVAPENRCEVCGRDLGEYWVIEPGIGKLCSSCYLDHTLGEGNGRGETDYVRSLNL